MQPFVRNAHGKIVFPSNVVPELDLSAIATLDQLDRVVHRDYETKAPTGTEIRARAEQAGYATRVELMRDVALNLFWTGRFAFALYEKRPTRWRDVPRSRPDVFLPALTPWVDADAKVAAVRTAFDALPAGGDDAAERGVFEVLFDVFGHRRHHATELGALKPTVAQVLEDPTSLTFRLVDFDPDYPTYSEADVLDCAEDDPELEALHRWAMVLHNQYPWDRSRVELVAVGELDPDDHVVVLHPRDDQVRRFLARVTGPEAAEPAVAAEPVEAVAPVRPYPATAVRSAYAVMPRIESLAVVHGEQPCTNTDLVRNSAYNWSPMSAEEIARKTGIESRNYTARSLEELALEAGRAALAKAGRGPADVGAVIVCTCTSTRMIPSVATYVSGELGIAQTHASYDLVAACAGMPYGLADAVRILQEVERPVLVICVEKFSDKIGNVRTSRMIFGDGAAAVVVGVAPEGAAPDIEYLQTYASGPTSQVSSIIWPNPDFDNNITVFGPEVKALAGRYLQQMIADLGALPDPDDAGRTLLESIELVVPHQANKTMVRELAEAAGLSVDDLYFNIGEVGNASSASIPLAIHDAVRDGVITEPVRVFAPGFGAGAVAGYGVLRIDPAVVAVTPRAPAAAGGTVPAGAGRPQAHPQTSADVALAFG